MQEEFEKDMPEVSEGYQRSDGTWPSASSSSSSSSLALQDRQEQETARVDSAPIAFDMSQVRDFDLSSLMDVVQSNPSNGKKRVQVRLERSRFIEANSARTRAIDIFRNGGNVLWDAEKEREWGAALEVTSGNPHTGRWALMPTLQETATATRPTGKRTGPTREEKERQDEEE